MSKKTEAMDQGCCAIVVVIGITAGLTVAKLGIKIFSWIWS